MLAAGCVASRTQPCGGDLVCGDGTSCVDVPQFDTHACVTRAQLDACAGIDDGKACMLDMTPGTCFSGACHPATCGDKIVDITEVCDEGDRIAGDGCSANCSSFEKCGDGLIDLSLGEQCDDGIVGLSGDGCTSSCTTEFAIWRDVTPPLVPPARNKFGLVTGLDGSVALYGGITAAGALSANVTYVLGDLWTFDGASWLPWEAVGPQPPLRTAFAFARDPRRNRLILFGGVSATNPMTPLSDVWEWDGVTWKDRTPASGPHPKARGDASFACTMTRCVLFGGSTTTTGAPDLNDLWSWDGTSWTMLTIGGPPLPRKRAAWIADPARDTFELVGGEGPSNVFYRDAWELGATAWTQTLSNNSSLIPPFAPYGAYDGAIQRSVVTAFDQSAIFDGITWQSLSTSPTGIEGLAYSPLAKKLIAVVSSGSLVTVVGDNQWTARPPTSPNRTAPTGVDRTTAAYDKRRARTLVVDSAGTWEWNGIGWRHTLTAGPAIADGAALAYDAACSTVIDHGGNTGTLLRDLWTHDGTTWKPRAMAPVGRAFHAMTFDDARKALVVFGGRTAAGVDATTYEWSGACGAQTWTNVTPTVSPPARTDAMMVYDAARKVSVLFGGVNGTTDLGDTWEWNGTAWKQVMATASPAPRFDHAMTYDARRKRVVLFGGRSQASWFNDTWEWDGAAGTWREVGTILSPPARSGGAMAQDPRGSLLVLGGINATGGSASELFRLRYERGLEPAEQCTLATVDLDKDGLAGCADPDCWTRCSPFCAPGAPCTAMRCGDAICDPAEDYLLCPADCPVLP